jgi:hypothetical protein
VKRGPEVLPSGKVVELPSPLLTTKELCVFLKCGDGTPEKWRRLKKGPPWIKTPYGIRYRVDQVETWLAEHSEPGGVMESKRRLPTPTPDELEEAVQP